MLDLCLGILFLCLKYLAYAVGMVGGVLLLIYYLQPILNYGHEVKGEVVVTECDVHYHLRTLTTSDCTARFTATAGGLAIPHVTFVSVTEWGPGDHVLRRLLPWVRARR